MTLLATRHEYIDTDECIIHIHTWCLTDEWSTMYTINICHGQLSLIMNKEFNELILIMNILLNIYSTMNSISTRH